MGDEAEVPAAVLEAYGLQPATVRRFERGVVNRHWLVTPHGRGPVVVGQYNEARTRAAIEWAQRLVEHAAAAGWPVPAPIPAIDGSSLTAHGGRWWEATRFLPGDFRGFDTPGEFFERGRLMAELHRDIASFPVRGQRPDLGSSWDLDAWVSPANSGTFDAVVEDFAGVSAELAETIRRERARNLAELGALGFGDLDAQPIHGDFGRWNLLWEDERLSGLLDFDQCRRDTPLADIADLLIPFMPLELPLVRALVAGYESVRSLSAQEWAALPVLARSGLLRWVTVLLVAWKLSGGVPDGIQRTMTVRLPAFDAAEAGYASLRDK